MSGLPDIGVLSTQVGYSRLVWPVSKDEAATGLAAMVRDGAEFIIGPAKGRTRWRLLTMRPRREAPRG